MKKTVNDFDVMKDKPQEATQCSISFQIIIFSIFYNFSFYLDLERSREINIKIRIMASETTIFKNTCAFDWKISCPLIKTVLLI